MNVLRSLFAISLMLTLSGSARAQSASPPERLLGVGGRQKPPTSLPVPQGLQDHVAGGKLVLTLDDSIRLALLKNTALHLEQYHIDFTQNNLGRAQHPFDPPATSPVSHIPANTLTHS